MDIRVLERITKFQKSWPLQKCKHETKFLKEKPKESILVPEAVSPEVSSTSDPDRLTIHVYLQDFRSESSEDNIPRRTKLGGKTGITNGVRATTLLGSDGYYGNHARRVNITEREKKTSIKGAELPSPISKQRYVQVKTRRRSSGRKSTAKKLPSKRTYIWQNEYNVWKSELQYGLDDADRPENSKSTLSGRTKTENEKPKLPRAEYNRYSAREHEKMLRNQAAIKIQALIRGWLTRHFLNKISVKRVSLPLMEEVVDICKEPGNTAKTFLASHMFMPWRTLCRDYLRLLHRVRYRNYTIRHRPRLNLQLMYKYLEKQQCFDDVFDTFTKLTLPLSALSDFVKLCQIRVSRKEVDDACRHVFKGAPSVCVALVVDASPVSSKENLKTNVELARDIAKKLLAAPFVDVISCTFGHDDLRVIRRLSDLQEAYKEKGKEIIEKEYQWQLQEKTLNQLQGWIKEPQKNVIKLGIMVSDQRQFTQKNSDLKILRDVFNQEKVPLFVVGDLPSTNVTYIVPASRLYPVTSNRIWNIKVDDILEDLLKKGRQAYATITTEAVCKSLHRADAMEILWTINPPPGSGCAQRKRRVSLYSILDKIDAWDLIDIERIEYSEMKMCMGSVIQTKLSRDGHVNLPRVDSEGTEKISDMKVAMERIQSLTEP